MRIQFQENKQQYRKPPERRSAVAEERQRYANHRKQSYCHADIHCEVKKENADHTVSVNPGEAAFLSFSNKNNPQQEGYK